MGWEQRTGKRSAAIHLPKVSISLIDFQFEYRGVARHAASSSPYLFFSPTGSCKALRVDLSHPAGSGKFCPPKQRKGAAGTKQPRMYGHRKKGRGAGAVPDIRVKVRRAPSTPGCRGRSKVKSVTRQAPDTRVKRPTQNTHP